MALPKNAEHTDIYYPGSPGGEFTITNKCPPFDIASLNKQFKVKGKHFSYLRTLLLLVGISAMMKSYFYIWKWNRHDLP